MLIIILVVVKDFNIISNGNSNSDSISNSNYNSNSNSNIVTDRLALI